MLEAMKQRFAACQPFEARAYADTGPVHERAAAKYAGLGWLGKNTLLINQGAGSWLFLGTILTSLELTPSLGPDELPAPDRCGTCRACLDACPTSAIVEPYVLDANRCISYLTIELRGSIAEGLRQPMGGHVFGCDICQDVCPWNRKSPRTAAAEFQPRNLKEGSLFLPDLLRLANLSEAEFRESFRGSPVKRTKWRGLVRNACIALGNSGLEPGGFAYAEVLRTLEHLAQSGEPVIAESARWALSRIERTGNRAGAGRDEL
jgi:epoxyqueuosine reductase